MIMTGEENNSSPQRKKSEAEVLSPKLSRAATTIAEEAVDQLQASEKLIAGELIVADPSTRVSGTFQTRDRVSGKGN